MAKKIFKMTESDVQNIVKKTVKRLVKEGTFYNDVDSM